jgi:rSAM/selenodomain-associated transferase 1
VVLAKEPRPGAVKTRLCPPLHPEEAAALAAAALADTLASARACGARRRVLVLEGRPGRFGDRDLDVVPQRGGSLGERLAFAFEDAWAGHPLPLLLIGMDTPQVGPALLDRCAGVLLGPDVEAVLGPAEDGGFWAIGTRHPLPELFAGVPMSTDGTGAAQWARLRALGLRRGLLPVARDVDRYEDALAVAAAAPGTRFAAALAALRPGPRHPALSGAGRG